MYDENKIDKIHLAFNVDEDYYFGYTLIKQYGRKKFFRDYKTWLDSRAWTVEDVDRMKYKHFTNVVIIFNNYFN